MNLLNTGWSLWSIEERVINGPATRSTGNTDFTDGLLLLEHRFTIANCSVYYGCMSKNAVEIAQIVSVSPRSISRKQDVVEIQPLCGYTFCLLLPNADGKEELLSAYGLVHR